MRILKATHLGMCFGVRDAIQLARERAAEGPVTILGELVHNAGVLEELRERGVRMARDVEDVTTTSVMITAHGASNQRLARVRNHGHEVVEATCPLVRHAHRSLQRLVEDGFHPVIIGRRGHVEVRGMTEDLEVFDVVLSDADVDALEERRRFGVVSQTTQPIGRARELVARLRARFPHSEVRFIDTVCQPTKQRQDAAVELARLSDVVIVVGGANSNNTAELVRTCSRYCASVHHVRGPGDLILEWLRGAGTVGITAGTSTPDNQIDAVENRLRELGRLAEQSSWPPTRQMIPA
jgi:4-hydroxy-3-methylbut-2-enyl diphosphate reductase